MNGFYVSFAMQGESGNYPVMKRCELMGRSIKRHLPNAKIVQISNDTFPQGPYVDEAIRKKNDGKNYIEKSLESLIDLLERGDNVLQIATDVMLFRDVSNIFDEDFDLASCRYSNKKKGKFCGDVNFWKPSGINFIKDFMKYYRETPKIQDSWEGWQTSFWVTASKQQAKIKELDYNVYCFTPENTQQSLSGVSIAHFRGHRKNMMKHYAIECGLCGPDF